MKRAIVLLCWSRPGYQRQVFEAVKRAHRDGWDVLIFVDGLFAVDSREIKLHRRKQQSECVRLAETMFPQAPIFINSINVGCAIQWTGVLSTVFDTLGYDEACLIEDDLVVSPNYFKNSAAVSDELGNHEGVGCWSCFGESSNPTHDENLHRLSSIAHFWGVTFPRHTWLEIRTDILDFARVTQKAGRPDCVEPVKKLLSSWGGPNEGGAVNDSAILVSLIKHGMVPLTTVANCARYIGKVGEHTTAEFFEEKGYNDLPFYSGLINLDIHDDAFVANALDHVRKGVA